MSGALVLAASLALAGLLAARPAGQASALSGAFVAAAAGAASMALLWRARSRPGLAWLLMGLGTLCWFIGECYWLAVDVLQGDDVALSSAIDVVYYLGYALFIGALGVFLLGATPQDRLRRAVDTLALSTVLLAIAWIAVLRDLVADSGLHLSQALPAVAYPALDLALAAAFALLAAEARPGARGALLLLSASALATFLGDLAYAWSGLRGGFTPGAPIDMAWVAAYGLLIAAARHRVAPEETLGRPQPRAALAVVYGPLFVLLLLAAIDYSSHGTMDAVLFTLGISMIALLALRQILLFSDARRDADRLRRSETQFRTLAEHFPDYITRVDRDLKRLYVNAAVRNLWSAAGAPDPQGTRVSEVIVTAAAQKAELEAVLRDALDSGQQRRLRQTVMLPDGPHILEGTVVPERDPDGFVESALVVARDVTAAEKATHALEEAARQLEEAQSIAHVGSWEADLTTGLAYESKEAWRIWGLPGDPEPRPVADFLALMHPEDKAVLDRQVEKALARGEDYEGLLRIRGPEPGTWRHVRNRGRISKRAPDGAPLRLAGTLEDVTERVAAQQRLRDSEERFRMAGAATQDVIWDYDVASDRLVWGDAIGTIMGHDPASLEPGLVSWSKHVHPDDRAKAVDAFDAALSNGALQWQGEYRFRRANGSWAQVLDRCTIVRGPDGKPRRVVGAMTDITALKQAESRARESRQALEQSNDGFYVVEAATGRFLDVTSSACAQTGYTREELLAMHVMEVDPTIPDLAAWQKLLAGVQAAGGSLVAESQTRRKDGSVGPVEVSVRIVPDGRTVAVVRDITLRKQAERQALEAQRLEQAAAFKTQFLNMAAHELATPLTPLKLQMATLRQQPGRTPEDLVAFDLLERNVNRMGTLVNDLLDAARLQSGRLRLAPKPIGLERLLRHVAGTFAAQAREAGVTLGIQASVGTHIAVGDEIRLTQVLVNLVHNALKFTPRGGQVWLREDLDGQNAVLTVRDTGIGLTTEQAARLFQPFSQVHDPTQVAVAGGTGLGLYIARGIVQQHGGDLTVASHGPGRGCTFKVRFPLSGPADASVPVNGPEPLPAASARDARRAAP